MNIAVIGGSNGGFATAADLALAGHRVRLWTRTAATFGPLHDDPTIQLVAQGRQGGARPERAATGPGGARPRPRPATPHEDLARRLAPPVTDRQTVLLTPGTFGSFVLARALARAGGTLALALAATGTLPYLTRKTGPAV